MTVRYQRHKIYNDRVLITGGAGFIGSRLVFTLLRQGYKVIVLDNHWTSFPKTLQPFRDNDDFTFVQADITDPIPSEVEPCSQIYHLACPASPVLFSKEPLRILDTCYSGTRNVLEKARDWKARVLLASTSEVYGQAEANPQSERYLGNVNCFGPRACYDEGKRAAEALAYAYRAQYGEVLDIRVARIFNAYGPRMHATDGRVVCSFIGAALQGEAMVITGDGKSTRCFQFVDDCVEGLERLMESSWQGGPINIGSEKETTIEELARLVASTVAKVTSMPEVQVVHHAPLPDDPVQRKPDCTLARQVLGWEVQTNLGEGLRKTIEWHLRLTETMEVEEPAKSAEAKR